jgi:hypothetical protein
MYKLIAAFLGIGLTVGIGGSIYDMTRHAAVSAKHAYQFDQISYAKFTKAMTEAKPRQPRSQK